MCIGEETVVAKEILDKKINQSLIKSKSWMSDSPPQKFMPDILYKYNGVPIPPLGMVDAILTVTNVENSLEINKLVNTFMESKKLRLSHKKCVQMHVGRGHENCPALNVHEIKMNVTDNE